MKNSELIFTYPSTWSIHEGIYMSSTQKELSTTFDAKMQNALFDIEDNSWWFQYRGQCIKSLLKKYFNPNHHIYDIGGGNGYTTKVLQNTGYEAVLLEPSLQACQNGKRRDLKNVICGTLNQDDFKDNSIDSCCLLDVLEHIENDNDFLKLIYNKLRPDGEILITVPALKMLWSKEDVDAGHFRRYTKKQLISLMENNNFKILYANYFFSFLLLPILFFRAWKDKLYSKKENIDKVHSSSSKIISFGLKIIEKTELKFLIKNKRIISGSSIICIAKKNK